MIYGITHRTEYRYAEPVLTCHNQVHLTPIDTLHQHCLSNRIQVEPAPRELVRHTDYFGNVATHFELDEQTDQLTITAVSEVEVNETADRTLDDSPTWEQVRHEIQTVREPRCIDAFQFAFASPYVPTGADYAAYARQSFSPDRPYLDATMDLTARIAADFRYDPQATDIATSVDEAFNNRHGVCQDFAHIELACLRSLGLPARYVSGYLRTDAPEGTDRLVGADASHAWVEVFSPNVGWVGFDPTNHCIANGRHVVVAVGRDYGDVSPIKGIVLGTGKHELTVAVDVTPIEEQREG